MLMNSSLDRYLTAQDATYATALAEIRSGKKRSHWMWYIFPQYKGLGNSNFSRLYAIQDMDEARAFLEHPILGFRLKEITTALLELANPDAYEVFGSPDDMKLKSCMTLFSAVNESSDNIFQMVLDMYFVGEQDHATLRLIQS
jgi:uncharacterized protein (DUF1810 family)